MKHRLLRRRLVIDRDGCHFNFPISAANLVIQPLRGYLARKKAPQPHGSSGKPPFKSGTKKGGVRYEETRRGASCDRLPPPPPPVSPRWRFFDPPWFGGLGRGSLFRYRRRRRGVPGTIRPPGGSEGGPLPGSASGRRWLPWPLPVWLPSLSLLPTLPVPWAVAVVPGGGGLAAGLAAVPIRAEGEGVALFPLAACRRSGAPLLPAANA